jgi:hypothetical protein
MTAGPKSADNARMWSAAQRCRPRHTLGEQAGKSGVGGSVIARLDTDVRQQYTNAAGINDYSSVSRGGVLALRVWATRCVCTRTPITEPVLLAQQLRLFLPQVWGTQCGQPLDQGNSCICHVGCHPDVSVRPHHARQQAFNEADWRAPRKLMNRMLTMPNAIRTVARRNIAPI